MPNPLGIHALVWAGGTTRDEVELCITKAAETGFDVLELSLHDLDHLDTTHAADAARAADIRLACSRGLAFDADISNADPQVVERGSVLLHRSVEATAALGGIILTGALYSALGKYPHAASATGRSHAVGVLREVAAHARSVGVDLGLEVCNRYETNVVNTAAEALRLADDIGADNVSVHLDTYHMNIEEDDFSRPVRILGDRLGYVHVGENHRGHLGSGHIDFDVFFHALASIGFTGPVTFESFSSAVVAPGLSDDLAVWRDLWDDGDELARRARGFLADQLASSAPTSAATGDVRR